MSENNYTIGVEEEYMICNPANGELIDKADEIISKIPDNLKDRFSYELLLSEIESNTVICDNVKEACKNVLFNRNFLSDIGADIGFKLGISGTHPTSKPSNQTFVNNESYNWVSEQLNYYAQRNITFSTHIHIGVQNPELIIKVTNSLRRWIAPMLALSVNSPFFDSIETGMQSSRTFQFSTFPRTNIPGFIKNLKEYNKLVDLYKRSGSIEKNRQIWWKIRPHIEYETVEFRVCDIQRSIKNTELLIALTQALVHTILTKEDFIKEDYNYEVLQDGLWKSAKYGLNANIIDPYNLQVLSIKNMVKIMLNYCDESLKYFNNTHIVNYANDIMEFGSESQQQLKIYRNGGFNRLNKYLMESVEYDY